MRRSISRTAMLGTFVAALAGCQLLTGSFNVGGSGPSCTALGDCCASLGAQATSCETFVQGGAEASCQAFLSGLPSGSCTIVLDSGIPPKDGGMSHQDGTAPGMDAKTNDVVQSHDVFQGHDAFHKDVFVGNDDSPGPQDSGQDTSVADPLDGTWGLADIQCDGSSVGVDGSATLIFSGTSVTETQGLSDGCTITTTLTSATVSETDITADDSDVVCGSGCSFEDDCTSGDMGTIDEPYTISEGVLSITLPDETGTCDSGSLTYLWTQD